LKTIIAGAIGECVHVAGVNNFLRLAELAGWRTIFLGPAVSIEKFLAVAKREKAEMVGVSYRLTPETGERLLAEFAEAADELRDSGVRFVFGGTPPVAEKARKSGFFERVFSGHESDTDVLSFLKGENRDSIIKEIFPNKTIDRINWKAPFPLLRHHFGLPTMQSTLVGIEMIAKAQVLDVISLGIDQDAQENFFHPERQDPRRKGAGGVPVRSEEDYSTLYQASRCGNFPLMRTYSGTDDFLKLAELTSNSINNAWCAIPLFWFNQMDGRGPWDLEGSIREHQKVMRWYGERGIPVELNEPHHWGMRDAPDIIFVVSAFLSAYNAKVFGVKDYIAQFMFNSPPETTDAMDLAKMITILKLIEPLQDDHFRIWRQTRTGLLSYPINPVSAKAHLATSVYLQMALKPHIIHVVGFNEADHAATAEDVIESCQLAQTAIEKALKGAPNFQNDEKIKSRVDHLLSEARFTLNTIRDLASSEGDPFVDPISLTQIVKYGILDAPHLKNNRFALGEIVTRIIDGTCKVVDEAGHPISESKRIEKLMEG